MKAKMLATICLLLATTATVLRAKPAAIFNLEE
ncbi:hypothetical protein ACVIHI_008293 [Bradyrhizobium sp. USDA 4524]|nr:hypothetical protein [Bradyrhizobium sp. USDA 4538]MCP1899350.1 hypothetical protein [Bradyrhizobium sp. USDA 4537]MCP1986538.1 hypothetical protein [Bradyrhizobium sp. USDA 4539]